MRALRNSWARLVRRRPDPATGSVETLPSAPSSASRRFKTPCNPPILSLLVVAFHHSKGPIVEYIYPPVVAELGSVLGTDILGDQGTRTPHREKSPLRSGVQLRLPSEAISLEPSEPSSDALKTEEDRCSPVGTALRLVDLLAAVPLVPFLALPDGSHRRVSDFVYFILPTASGRPLFGISCSRRISADSLVHVDADVTRSHIQKAVCVISQYPAFAYLRNRIAPATLSYFAQRDFRNTSILERLYDDLNASSVIARPPVPNPFGNVPERVWTGLCAMAKQEGTKILETDEILDSKEKEPLSLMKPKHLFALVKAILLEVKVAIFCRDAALVSSLVLVLSSFLPYGHLQGVFLSGMLNQPEVLIRCRQFGVPLETWGKKRLVLPYVSLQMMADLEKCDSFLIGVSNKVILTPAVLKTDLVYSIDMETRSADLEIRDRNLQTQLEMSTYDHKFVRRRLAPLLASGSKEDVSPCTQESDSSTPHHETSSTSDTSSVHRSSKPRSFGTRRSIEHVDQKNGGLMRRMNPLMMGLRMGSKESDRLLLGSVKLRLPRGLDPSNFDEMETSPVETARPVSARTFSPISRAVGGSQTERTSRTFRMLSDQQSVEQVELLRREIVSYVEVLLRVMAYAAGPERCANSARRAIEGRMVGTVNFSPLFLRAWMQTSNFETWLGQHQLPTVPTYTEAPSSGWGRFVFPNGDIYSGQFHKSLRHGQGAYESTTGLTYEGLWANDKRHGIGTVRLAESSYCYTGGWKDDLKDGSGILISKREKYAGGFCNNKFQGHGVYTDSWNTQYEGDFHEGLFHGKGRLTLPTMEEYDGEWVHGKFHGPGKRVLSGDRVLRCTFEEGVAAGKGTMTFEDGSVFEGNWVNGKRHGTGIFHFVLPSASGDFRSDTWDPTSVPHVVLEGSWRCDFPCRHSEWRITFSSTGAAYSGSLTFYAATFRSSALPSPTHVRRSFVLPSPPSLIEAVCVAHQQHPHPVHLSLNQTRRGSTDSRREPNSSWPEGFICQCPAALKSPLILPHGRGTFVLKDGEEFSGFWSHGILVTSENWRAEEFWSDLIHLTPNFFSTEAL